MNNIVIYSKETVTMLDKVGVYLKAMVEEKTIIEKFTTKNYFNDNYNYSIVEEVLKHWDLNFLQFSTSHLPVIYKQ